MSCSLYTPYSRMSQQAYQNNGGTPPPDRLRQARSHRALPHR